MSQRVIAASANNDFTLFITFVNGETGVFDVKPYLNMGKFKELQDFNNFRRFHIDDGVITWYNGIDLAPDTVYLMKQ